MVVPMRAASLDRTAHADALRGLSRGVTGATRLAAEPQLGLPRLPDVPPGASLGEAGLTAMAAGGVTWVLAEDAGGDLVAVHEPTGAVFLVAAVPREPEPSPHGYAATYTDHEGEDRDRVGVWADGAL